MKSIVVGLFSIFLSTVAFAQEHRRPPEEAFTACDGKAENASCSLTIGERSMTGTCLKPPPHANESRLVCAPPRGEGPPPRLK